MSDRDKTHYYGDDCQPPHEPSWQERAVVAEERLARMDTELTEHIDLLVNTQAKCAELRGLLREAQRFCGAEQADARDLSARISAALGEQ